MKNARHVIAVTLMATAICADRALPAAPPEQITSCFAGRLIERLTDNFRRVVPSPSIYRPQRFGLPPEKISPSSPTLTVAISPRLSPFQFRLPPPLC